MEEDQRVDGRVQHQLSEGAAHELSDGAALPTRLLRRTLGLVVRRRRPVDNREREAAQRRRGQLVLDRRPERPCSPREPRLVVR